MDPPAVVLVRPLHPGNVGASARAAANFGVTDLRIVAPRCDVLGKEARDRAVHADSLLGRATLHPDLKSALAGTALSVGTTARSQEAEHRHQRKPMDIRDWATGLADVDAACALVFGPEDTGLSREEAGGLDQLVTIPTAEYWSLNLSHAVAVACYEHLRVRDTQSLTQPRTLEPGALQALHAAWDALIDETEGRPWRRETAATVWRKVVGRSNPDTYEVHNIMGILTGSLRRFGNPDYQTEKSERTLREKGLLVDDERPSE